MSDLLIIHLDTLVVVDYIEDIVGLWQNLDGALVEWVLEEAVACSY